MKWARATGDRGAAPPLAPAPSRSPAPVAGAAPGSPAAALAQARRHGLRMRPQRPLRALVGAFLVVAAVVAALAVYTSLGDRTEVLAVNRNVLAGERITASDLRVVAISTDDDLPVVGATDRDRIVGRYARVRLPSGALLAADSVQDRPLVDPDSVLMAVEVPAGHVPHGLREQSRIVLVVIADRTRGDVPPSLVDATVAAVPGNLAELVGDPSATVTLSVEVAASDVPVVGAAGSIRVGVLDPTGDSSRASTTASGDTTNGATG